MPDSKPSMPAQVRHVKDALVTEFYGRIDLSDLSPTRQNADDSAFLTRALSALSTRMLTNCTSDEAAICVIDGRDDYGIDAVGTSDTAPVIWLIQAKWSNKGEAGFDTAAANKLVRGFKKLDEQDFDRFNSKFQTLAPKVKSILSDPNCMVKLVVAIMGENELHTDVEEVLIDAANDFNVFGRSVSHQILKGTDFHAQVRADIAPQPISITATMDSGWHYRDTPYEAYYGLVSMDEVANWHQTFGDKLFAKNVRKSLGLTTVNKRIVDTLNESPENFWYFNNGITIICQEVNKEFFKKRAAGEPVKIHMRDASIVNGAQTVASTDLATKNTETTLTDAYATVRVICLQEAEKDFAAQITEATNTQNHMEQRDFIAIDSTQERIREEFELSLQKSYTFKRGEMDPPPELGCSVVHAAIALACAHPNPIWAINAKQNSDLLWEKGSGGAYTVLFGNSPTAFQIWRSVQAMRMTAAELHSIRDGLVGRASAIIDHGDLLILHLVFQFLDTNEIDDPDLDWSAKLAQIPQTVTSIVWILIHSLNEEFGLTSFVSSTFASTDRALRLVDLVKIGLAKEPAKPVNIDEFRKPTKTTGKRRPTAVKLLLDAKILKTGTPLAYNITSETERKAISRWISQDASRGLATWNGGTSRPLTWKYDGEDYSPSGLTTKIWSMAGWDDSWVAVQGPKQWSVLGGETLAELASAIWSDLSKSSD